MFPTNSASEKTAGKDAMEFQETKNGYTVLDIPEPCISGPYEFHPNLRNAFLRRVYAILTTQIAITALVTLLCVFQPAVRAFCLSYGPAVLWGTLIPSICLLVWLHFIKNKYPLNLAVMYLFTLVQSFVVGAVCALYYDSGYGIVIAQAAFLSLVMFVALTSYVLISKRDFSYLGGFLGGGLAVLIVWGILNIVFGFHLQFIFSLCGALLFCGFIVYDTYAVSQEYDIDQYVEASIQLYLNMINLFLYMLQLLRGSSD